MRGAASAGQKIYGAKEVDTSANLIWTGRGPKHPGADGDISVQIVVDSSGVPDLATVRPVTPSSPALYASVVRFLSSAKYKPARIGAHAVIECLEFTAQFRSGDPNVKVKLPPVYPRPSF
jgi:hypothetical protein